VWRRLLAHLAQLGQSVADAARTSLRQDDEDKTGYGNVVAETQIGSLPAGNHICNGGFQLLVKGIRGTVVDGTFALVS
jgi:hypothetical protein